MINVKNVQSLSSCFNDFKEFLNENLDDEFTIIVPDKLALFMERYIFEATGIESSFNLKVVTLNRLIKRDLDVDETKKLTSIGSILLIGKILSEHGDEFNSFKAKTYSFSYAEEVFNTISQFKASNITAGEMNRKYDDVACGFPLCDRGEYGEIFRIRQLSVSSGN